MRNAYRSTQFLMSFIHRYQHSNLKGHSLHFTSNLKSHAQTAWQLHQLFLVHFRRVRKISKRDCQLRHFCMSVRMERLRSYWTRFHYILYLSIKRKSFEKLQVSFRSDRNSGRFTLRPKYMYDISLNFSWNEKCFRQKLWRKSKHISC